MFGKVINLKDNCIIVENTSNQVPLVLQGIHVVFEEEKRKVVGQILSLDEKQFEIIIIGEIVDNKFTSGVYKIPQGTNPPRIVTGNELVTFIGNQDYQEPNTLLIGQSPLYEKYRVTANYDDFFSNHFAIIGNSGSGKSCGVARIIQNAFLLHKDTPKHAHIVLFDVYGEYHKAFECLNDYPGLHYKVYKNDSVSNTIKIPPMFLDADDLAILLDVDNSHLIPILEKTLYYVKIFKSDDEISLKYKNSILASVLLEMLSMGNSASVVRDQILSILERYSTEDINADSIIYEPGYSRTLRQCLNIDAQGKINAISLVINFLKDFPNLNLRDFKGNVPNGYTLKDIYDALEFSLLSEGIYQNDDMYEKASVLKVRLEQIINGYYNEFFTYQGNITKEEYIKRLFLNEDNEEVQIINVSLDSVEDRFAKVLTKLYSRLFFQFATSLNPRGSFPIHIVLEEAHRYVNNDDDIKVIGYNIFDRITKEGRKYGVIIGLITQRPHELSHTALSQCSNFLIFRIFHPDDYQMIVSMTSSISKDELSKLKILRRGSALCFGSAFATPLLVQLDMPAPSPSSSNVRITDTWYDKKEV